MDVDEHIDLVDTLGDMLGQKAESKKDKFIDTMPNIIQMHLKRLGSDKEESQRVRAYN